MAYSLPVPLVRYITIISRYGDSHVNMDSVRWL